MWVRAATKILESASVMRKASQWLGLVTLSLGMLTGFSAPASAGSFVVSGDTNIINGLDGSLGAPIPNDNGVFFNNVLQGGTSVLIFAGTQLDGNPNAPQIVNTFYNAQAGVTSSIGSGSVTAGDLTGVNLLVVILPDNAFSASELAAVNGFLNGGGRVFFMGENNNPTFTAANTAISTDLALLGSALTYVPNSLDPGFNTATVGNGQVVTNALTAGVNTFVYAAVSGVTGGQALFLTTDGTPFVEGATSNRDRPRALSLVLASFATLICSGFALLPGAESILRACRTSESERIRIALVGRECRSAIVISLAARFT